MITMDNYEGWLMRYADGELSDAECTEVERFLAEHPELREELEGVCSVKVTAPVASFAGKEKLLQKEGFVWTPVWRAAAAVALLLVAGGTALLLKPTEESTPLMAKAERINETKKADTIVATEILSRDAALSVLQTVSQTVMEREIIALDHPIDSILPVPTSEEPLMAEATNPTVEEEKPRLRGGVLVVETHTLVSQEAQLATSERPSTLERLQGFFTRPE